MMEEDEREGREEEKAMADQMNVSCRAKRKDSEKRAESSPVADDLSPGMVLLPSVSLFAARVLQQEDPCTITHTDTQNTDLQSRQT